MSHHLFPHHLFSPRFVFPFFPFSFKMKYFALLTWSFSLCLNPWLPGTISSGHQARGFFCPLTSVIFASFQSSPLCSFQMVVVKFPFSLTCLRSSLSCQSIICIRQFAAALRHIMRSYRIALDEWMFPLSERLTPFSLSCARSQIWLSMKRLLAVPLWPLLLLQVASTHTTSSCMSSCCAVLFPSHSCCSFYGMHTSSMLLRPALKCTSTVVKPHAARKKELWDFEYQLQFYASYVMFLFYSLISCRHSATLMILGWEKIGRNSSGLTSLAGRAFIMFELLLAHLVGFDSLILTHRSFWRHVLLPSSHLPSEDGLQWKLVTDPAEAPEGILLLWQLLCAYSVRVMCTVPRILKILKDGFYAVRWDAVFRQLRRNHSALLQDSVTSWCFSTCKDLSHSHVWSVILFSFQFLECSNLPKAAQLWDSWVLSCRTTCVQWDFDELRDHIVIMVCGNWSPM